MRHEAALAEHSAIVQGNSAAGQLAFARAGSVAHLDDVLVTRKDLCPYEMMSAQLSDLTKNHSHETSEAEKQHYLLLM